MIDGRWHMYFAAGNSDNPFHIRTYVLVCKDKDALNGRWEVLGRLDTGWDSFTLDSSVFEHKGQRYVTWAQADGDIGGIYLAPLATPLTLARPAMQLSRPTLAWERQGFNVNEGTTLLKRNGKLFMAYSASATDSRYCLGMLTADENADIMDPASWAKSPVPVFQSSPATSVYGPGHNSFTVDEQGRDILVYHGRDYEHINGDPLFDPNRHTRVQRFYWKADGTPDFGIPVGNGAIPDRLSPADRPNSYLAHNFWRLVLSTDALVGVTQFRQVPGLAGGDTISLQTLQYRDHYLVAMPDGSVMLSTVAENREAALRASFVTRSGLTKASGISFVSAFNRTAYLHRAGDAIKVAPISSAQRASATFLIS